MTHLIQLYERYIALSQPTTEQAMVLKEISREKAKLVTVPAENWQTTDKVTKYDYP